MNVLEVPGGGERLYWCIVKFYADRSVALHRHGDSAGIVSQHFKFWELLCLLFSRYNTKVWHQSFVKSTFRSMKKGSCGSGVGPGFTKGGAQIQYCEHDNCVRSTYSGMQSMPNLGGSEGMPPQKILKN